MKLLVAVIILLRVCRGVVFEKVVLTKSFFVNKSCYSSDGTFSVFLKVSRLQTRLSMIIVEFENQNGGSIGVCTSN